MQCPIDQATLAIAERQGIEIDYCPTCRGVWLDRGELDKIIAASSSHSDSETYEQPRSLNREQRRPDHDDRSYEHDRKRKKKSFLGDIFDF